MKKEAMRTWLSLLIIVVMFISVLGYAAMNVLSSQTTSSELTGYIMKQNVSDAVRQTYIQRGFTFVDLHYNQNTDLMSIEGLASQLSTPSNQVQVILIEIYDSSEYARAESMNGDVVFNVTDINTVAKGICGVLVYPPLDCFANSINLTGMVGENNGSAISDIEENTTENINISDTGLTGKTISGNSSNTSQ